MNITVLCSIWHFRDGAGAVEEYEYDENGNMTKDLNSNISHNHGVGSAQGDNNRINTVKYLHIHKLISTFVFA